VRAGDLALPEAYPIHNLRFVEAMAVRTLHEDLHTSLLPDEVVRAFVQRIEHGSSASAGPGVTCSSVPIVR
jgi:hypothetical protein